MNQALSPEAQRQVRVGLARAAIEPCFLCGSPGSYPAIFQPNEKWVRLRGGRQDKTYVFFYALCERCFSYEDHSAEAVEERLRREAVRV